MVSKCTPPPTYLTDWLAAPLAHYGGHRLSAATLHCGCNRKSVDRCLSDRVTFAQAAPMSWTSILEQVIKVIVMRRYSTGNGIYFNCTEWHCYAIVILSIRDKLITIGRIHKGRYLPTQVRSCTSACYVSLALARIETVLCFRSDLSLSFIFSIQKKNAPPFTAD